MPARPSLSVEDRVLASIAHFADVDDASPTGIEQRRCDLVVPFQKSGDALLFFVRLVHI